MSEDSILIKYVDDGKIITTINRPTENAALRMLYYGREPSKFCLQVYELEMQLLKQKHDPANFVTLISNELKVSKRIVAKNLKRMSQYLEYNELLG